MYGKRVHLVCRSLPPSLPYGPVSPFVFHLFSAFQLTLTSFPPPWKPHLSSTPSPVSSPPSAWVWLSSLYRGRWGHKTAGEARGGPRDEVCAWLITTRISPEHLCKPCTRTTLRSLIFAVVSVCASVCQAVTSRTPAESVAGITHHVACKAKCWFISQLPLRKCLPCSLQWFTASRWYLRVCCAACIHHKYAR